MLLPYVTEFNKGVIEEKLMDIGRAMGLNIIGVSAELEVDLVIENLYMLVKDLNIPSDLKQFGIKVEDLDQLAEAASKVTRLLDNNPKALTMDDIKNIYRKLI